MPLRTRDAERTPGNRKDSSLSIWRRRIQTEAVLLFLRMSLGAESRDCACLSGGGAAEKAVHCGGGASLTPGGRG